MNIYDTTITREDSTLVVMGRLRFCAVVMGHMTCDAIVTCHASQKCRRNQTLLNRASDANLYQELPFVCF